MTEFLSVRPNLEVADLGPTVAHLVDVFGFEVWEIGDDLVDRHPVSHHGYDRRDRNA